MNERRDTNAKHLEVGTMSQEIRKVLLCVPFNVTTAWIYIIIISFLIISFFLLPSLSSLSSIRKQIMITHTQSQRGEACVMG